MAEVPTRKNFSGIPLIINDLEDGHSTISDGFAIKRDHGTKWIELDAQSKLKRRRGLHILLQQGKIKRKYYSDFRESSPVYTIQLSLGAMERVNENCKRLGQKLDEFILTRLIDIDDQPSISESLELEELTEKVNNSLPNILASLESIHSEVRALTASNDEFFRGKGFKNGDSG